MFKDDILFYTSLKMIISSHCETEEGSWEDGREGEGEKGD